MSASTLLLPRWLVPVEPSGVVLEQHAVLVEEGRIAAVLPREAALARHANAERVELPEHLLVPGLVNAHTHAAMSLLRGYADDLPLMRWLTEHIWPAEAKHVTPAFVRDGTLLACAEMLRGGVTCFNDMYFFPEAALEAARAAGMRASIGMIVIDFPSAYATDAEDYLEKGLALRDRAGDAPLASFCLAPHAPYTVSDATLRRVASLAGELDLPVHIHVQETADEVRRSIEEHGVRPLERMQRHGLLGPNLIAVHAVHVNAADIELLARHGCSVVHCPGSNLKLASGFAPVAALLGAGVNVALGTDGAASNNRLDVLAEMRLAALLAKGVSGDAGALPAHAALRAATLGGAAALGLDRLIGSIVEGKRADLVALRIAGPELSPCYDPVSHLVYAAGRENVSHVWVDGALRVEAGTLLGGGLAGLDKQTSLWHTVISQDVES
ncbi:MAG TPA: TRZ/ATZ family hydrolase [Burkholderiales bacterium]